MTTTKVAPACMTAGLEYLKLGWAPVKLCSPDHRNVGDRHRTTCHHPGETPMQADWRTLRVTEEGLPKLWEATPTGNVGVAVGPLSGLFVIVASTEAAGKGLPATLTCEGPAGLQYLYRWPALLNSDKTWERTEVDGLTALPPGSVCVMPPSKRADGSEYEWVMGARPGEGRLGECPVWLLEKLGVLPAVAQPGPHKAALTYARAGLSIVPVGIGKEKRPDGSRLPREWDESEGREKAVWKPFQSRLPTPEELARWFDTPQPAGIGVICGKVSGGLETIDFDEEADTIYPEWRDLVEDELPGLVARLCVVQTPSGGYHVRYRCTEIAIPGNLDLAIDPSKPKEDRRTLIETRGEGGYAIAPGSPLEVHATKRPYAHLAGPDLVNLPTITADEREVLIRCARFFDRRPPTVDATPRLPGVDLRPGDYFDRDGWPWSDILAGAGWAMVRDYGEWQLWRRPGKEKGWSATTGKCRGKNGEPLLKMFTSSAHPFEQGRCYGRFRAFALLQHNGDMSMAAQDLRRNHGFGAPPKSNGAANGKAHTSASRGKPAQPSEARPYQPFPVDALPPVLANFVAETARSLGCDPAYLALPVLAVVASMIGNTRSLKLKPDWDELPIIWAALVATSGGLKSPAIKKAIAAVYRIQKRMIEEHSNKTATYQEKVREARRDDNAPDPGQAPKCKRIVASDTTIEKLAEILEDNPRGTLLARDELSGWLGSFTRYKGKGGGTDLPNWLELHNGGTLIIDRKTGERRTLFVPHASVGVTGGFQPGVLARAMTAESMDAGLWARLLLAMPPKTAKRWTEFSVSEATKKAWSDLLEGLLLLEFGSERTTGERCPQYVYLDDGAKELWVRWYEEWAGEQFNVEGELAAAFAKLEAYAARLALVHHVVSHVAAGRDGLLMMGAESMAAGIQMTRWFANEAERIYMVLGGSAEEQLTSSLIDWIVSHGGRATVRQVHRSNQRRYRGATAAREAMELLVKGGMARWIKGNDDCDVLELVQPSADAAPAASKTGANV